MTGVKIVLVKIEKSDPLIGAGESARMLALLL